MATQKEIRLRQMVNDALEAVNQREQALTDTINMLQNSTSVLRRAVHRMVEAEAGARARELRTRAAVRKTMAAIVEEISL
tara:strand:+ start:280 stop:519 length:240 start_codon:yes stop_codon:yes gene_type:complete